MFINKSGFVEEIRFLCLYSTQDPSVTWTPSRMTRGFNAIKGSARHPQTKRKRSEGSCAADKLGFNELFKNKCLAQTTPQRVILSGTKFC